MFNKLVFTALAILFFIAPVQAIEISAPHTIDRLNIDFVQYGAVSVSKGNVQHIAINISTFQNSENQKTALAGNYTSALDEFGNERLNIVQKSDSLKLKYSVAGSSEISAKHTYEIPQSYSLSGIDRAYIMPSKNIQSDDPKIYALARNITFGAASDFEKAARLAIWVHKSVNYTLDLGDMAKDAIWVLNNKIGTCDEFTSLYIAMARSIGIPAKYVSGWVYGNTGWQKHAWTEIYVGKWVPVDATWLEAGNLDATHIKFMETADNYVANQATALGTGLGAIEWLSDNASISVKSLRESDAMPSELFSSISGAGNNKENIIGTGKSAIIGLKITPEEYIIEKFTMAPCKGMDIVRIDNAEQDAILIPGKETIIIWKISANENLGANSVYTCPITVNSRFFEKKIFELTVDPRVKDSISLSANLDKNIAQANEVLAAAVTVKDASRKGAIKIGIASENAIAEKEVNLNDAEESAAEFKFSAGGVGEHKIYIYSDRSDVIEQSYNVYEAGEVFIESVKVPEYSPIGEKPYAAIYLRNNKHSAASAKFSATLNGADAFGETIAIPAHSTHIVNLTIPADKKGTLKLAFRLVSDSSEEKLAEVRIYNTITIALVGHYDSGTKSALLKITPIGDDIKNIEAVAGGQTKTISYAKENMPTEMAFNLVPGIYDAKITYSDVAGGLHEITQKIEFKKKGLFDYIIDLFSKAVSFFNSLF